jgi:hypothetical protein
MGTQKKKKNIGTSDTVKLRSLEEYFGFSEELFE